MAATSVASGGNKNDKQSADSISKKNDSAYHQKDLFLPKNHVSYFVYKPAPPNSPIYYKVFNSLQLVYYKYQLATGIYMMNERERAMINFLVLASLILTFYHFIL